MYNYKKVCSYKSKDKSKDFEVSAVLQSEEKRVRLEKKLCFLFDK